MLLDFQIAGENTHTHIQREDRERRAECMCSYGKVFFIVVEVVQRERLVGGAYPEHVVDINLKGFHAANCDDIAQIKLSALFICIVVVFVGNKSYGYNSSVISAISRLNSLYSFYVLLFMFVPCIEQDCSGICLLSWVQFQLIFK